MTTPTYDFTPQQAYDALKSVVDSSPDGPDTVYQKIERFGTRVCRYEDGGQPSCLVGKALFLLGVPLDTLRAFDGGTAISAFSLHRHGIGTLDTSEVLYAAQEKQDHNGTWGGALQAAKAQLKRVEEREK